MGGGKGATLGKSDAGPELVSGAAKLGLVQIAGPGLTPGAALPGSEGSAWLTVLQDSAGDLNC